MLRTPLGSHLTSSPLLLRASHIQNLGTKLLKHELVEDISHSNHNNSSFLLPVTVLGQPATPTESPSSLLSSHISHPCFLFSHCTQ